MSVEPIIIDEKIFKLIGVVYYGNPFHSAEPWSPKNEIGNTWNRFFGLYMKYKEFLDKIRAGNEIGYEIHIEPADYDLKRKFHIYVGLEVINFDFLPLEMFVKTLPKSRYVKFTTKIQDRDRCENMFWEWMPKNGYVQAYPYILQGYDSKRYKGLDDSNSEIDWLIPINTIGGEE